MVIVERTLMVSDSNRTCRDDLRAAAFFVIDPHRQLIGFDKSRAGSASIPDVVRIFDECLGTFPLYQEVGRSLRTEAEIQVWEPVLVALEPIWRAWHHAAWSRDMADALVRSGGWRALERAVRTAVSRLQLWREEVELPVLVGDRIVPTWGGRSDGNARSLYVVDDRNRRRRTHGAYGTRRGHRRGEVRIVASLGRLKRARACGVGGAYAGQHNANYVMNDVFK